MNIAITQRELIIRNVHYDCLDHNWYTLLKNHKIFAIPNQGLYNLDNIDLLIFGGGNNSELRKETETKTFKMAIEKDIPIIGICHGAFVLNLLHGGDIFEDIDDHHGVEHEVELEGEWQMVNSFHTVGIATLAEELVAIAKDREYNIEAFKHKEKRIWGIVWHPERMDKPILPKEIKELLNSA